MLNFIKNTALKSCWEAGVPRIPHYHFIFITIGKLRKNNPTALPITKPFTCSQTQSQTQAHNILVSEPSSEMTEQRMECLEKEMGSMEERLRKQME